MLDYTWSNRIALTMETLKETLMASLVTGLMIWALMFFAAIAFVVACVIVTLGFIQLAFGIWEMLKLPLLPKKKVDHL